MVTAEPRILFCQTIPSCLVNPALVHVDSRSIFFVRAVIICSICKPPSWALRRRAYVL